MEISSVVFPQSCLLSEVAVAWPYFNTLFTAPLVAVPRKRATHPTTQVIIINARSDPDRQSVAAAQFSMW